MLLATDNGRMGLDARVRCSCWEEGATAPFDHPELLHLENGYVTLRVDWNRKTQPLHAKYHHWLEQCCPHPRMTLHHEWIANWYGVSSFRSALFELGEHQFPTLLEEIRGERGGPTEASQSIRCLRELELFLKCPPFGIQVWVVNSATGERMQKCTVDDFAAILVPRSKKLWERSRNIVEIGAGAAGIFVKDRGAGELFRAKEVQQVRLRSGDIQLTDTDTGASIVAPEGFGVVTGYDRSDRAIWSYPEKVRVDVGPNAPAEYADMVARLREIFWTSVTSGNPVHWF